MQTEAQKKAKEKYDSANTKGRHPREAWNGQHTGIHQGTHPSGYQAG